MSSPSCSTEPLLLFTEQCPYVLNWPPFLPLVSGALLLLIIVPFVFVHSCSADATSNLTSISRSWRSPAGIFSVGCFCILTIIWTSVCVASGGLIALMIVLTVCLALIASFNPSDKEKERTTPRAIHGLFALVVFIGIFICAVLVGAFKIFITSSPFSNGSKFLYVILITVASACLLYLIGIAISKSACRDAPLLTWKGVANVAEYLLIINSLIVVGFFVAFGCIN